MLQFKTSKNLKILSEFDEDEYFHDHVLNHPTLNNALITASIIACKKGAPIFELNDLIYYYCSNCGKFRLVPNIDGFCEACNESYNALNTYLN